MTATILEFTGMTDGALRGALPGGLISSAGLVQQSDGYHMDWGGSGVWWGFGMMAILWVPVIVLAWWAIASYNRRNEPPRNEPARDGPLEVAKHRYARGEITAEEFERLKRDLS